MTKTIIVRGREPQPHTQPTEHTPPPPQPLPPPVSVYRAPPRAPDEVPEVRSTTPATPSRWEDLGRADAATVARFVASLLGETKPAAVEQIREMAVAYGVESLRIWHDAAKQTMDAGGMTAPMADGTEVQRTLGGTFFQIAFEELGPERARAVTYWRNKLDTDAAMEAWFGPHWRTLLNKRSRGSLYAEARAGVAAAASGDAAAKARITAVAAGKAPANVDAPAAPPAVVQAPAQPHEQPAPPASAPAVPRKRTAETIDAARAGAAFTRRFLKEPGILRNVLRAAVKETHGAGPAMVDVVGRLIAEEFGVRLGRAILRNTLERARKARLVSRTKVGTAYLWTFGADAPRRANAPAAPSTLKQARGRARAATAPRGNGQGNQLARVLTGLVHTAHQLGREMETVAHLQEQLRQIHRR